MIAETVYVVLCSWGGTHFTVYCVCRTKARATNIVAAQQKLHGPRQWLVQPTAVDEESQ